MTVTILCSSARLARALGQHLQSMQAMDAQASWQACHVLPWTAWLKQCYEQLSLTGGLPETQGLRHLLTPFQEELLWERAIRQCLKGHQAAMLFDTSGLARVAMEAHRYWQEWQLPFQSAAWLSEESKQFLTWHKAFVRLCDATHSLPSVRWMSCVLDALASGAGTVPERMCLAGFDQTNPFLARLQAILRQRGVQVDEYVLGVEAPALASCVRANDAEQECRAAVAWAVASMQAQPEGRFAIVVPDLEQRRSLLIRLLDEALHPETILPAQVEVPRQYEVSLGLPLAQWPFVQSALHLLRLLVSRQALEQTEYSEWLESVYVSASLSERDGRAQLDAWMRKTLPSTLRIEQFYAAVERERLAPWLTGLSTWLMHLDALHARRQAMPQRQSLREWSRWLAESLEAIGWPGERGLSSVEYQTYKAFASALQGLAELSVWVETATGMEAVQRLTQWCQTQIFQPETVGQPRLVLTGMLEATPHTLDGVWLMGLNDHLWPPAPRVNPLLPADMQREYRTPNASSEVQTGFASQVLARVMRSASAVTVSYAERDGERHLRPSPLLPSNIMQDAVSVHAVQQTLAEQWAYAVPHDAKVWLDDAHAPPVQAGERVSGGANLLKAQAICPAWAFYQYRLGAKALASPEPGLDASERGSLLHAVLANTMKNKDSQWLAAQSHEALEAQMATHTQAVLQAFALNQPGRFDDVFYTLESERLTRLATAWIWEKERERSVPFAVEYCEHSIKTTIEGIAVEFVIDRVDMLDDGRRLVMDYKTSSQLSYQSWASEAITEPQLPMYAAILLQEQTVAAVCFARVKLGDHQWIGIAAEADLLPDVEVLGAKKNSAFDRDRFPTWPSVMQHWRNRIQATARGLREGNAAVLVENESALRYCEVLPLLRLPERQLQFEALSTLPRAE